MSRRISAGGYSPLADPPAVVLEFGSAYTKVGFSGESKPRGYLKMNPDWQAAYGGYASTISMPSDTYGWINEEGADAAPLESFARRSVIDWTLALDAMLREIFFKYLLVNASSRRIVVCEHVLSPSLFRKALLRLLFGKFKATSVRLVASQACVAVALDERDGAILVADCGFSATRVMPMLHGFGDVAALTTTPIASRCVHSKLKESLVDGAMLLARDGGGGGVGGGGDVSTMTHKNPAKENQSAWVPFLEDIVIRTCYVLPKGESSVEESDAGDTIYPLHPHSLLFAEDVKWKATEVLFHSPEDEDGVCSVPEAILGCLLKSPVDSRRTLAHHIALVGGAAELPGYTTRILNELDRMVTTPRFTELEGLVGQFRACSGDFAPHDLCWVGASILASAEGDCDITSESYFAKSASSCTDWTATTLVTSR